MNEINEASIYPNLKKQIKIGDNTTKNDLWKKENILDGLKKFYDENGRYPVAEEIDAYEYLPSSRQIQRSFGGLVKLRQDLGLTISNYSAGESRSKQATEIGVRGAHSEREMEEILTQHFGEHFVHVEKPLYKYFLPSVDLQKRFKLRADFFVYAKNKNLCIDVFFARDMSTLKRIINIKELKYSGLAIDVFLVNLNDKSNIEGEELKRFAINKKRRLEQNLKLLNKDEFIQYIQTLEPIKQ